MTKIKICGCRSLDDIQIMNKVKPDYCGFVIDYPKSHRSCTYEEVVELVRGLDREAVIPVGVFVDAKKEQVAKLINEGVIDLAQLHGNEDESYVQELRKMLSPQKQNCIVKAFQIRSITDLEKVQNSSADYVLLDQGKGEGTCFDWSLLQERNIGHSQWFLAGGLTEDNILGAIQRLHPMGVDLSSSVETDLKKDPEKVKRIVEIVRSSNV